MVYSLSCVGIVVLCRVCHKRPVEGLFVERPPEVESDLDAVSVVIGDA